MSSATPLASLEHSCKATLRWVRVRLSREGLSALQTFDLHNARLATAACPCPHHGTKACDCQMVVLLVYGQASGPATLIVHGDDSHSWLSLVSAAAEHNDGMLRGAIEHALQINYP